VPSQGNLKGRGKGTISREFKGLEGNNICFEIMWLRVPQITTINYEIKKLGSGQSLRMVFLKNLFQSLWTRVNLGRIYSPDFKIIFNIANFDGIQLIQECQDDCKLFFLDLRSTNLNFCPLYSPNS